MNLSPEELQDKIRNDRNLQEMMERAGIDSRGIIREYFTWKHDKQRQNKTCILRVFYSYKFYVLKLQCLSNYAIIWCRDCQDGRRFALLSRGLLLPSDYISFDL